MVFNLARTHSGIELHLRVDKPQHLLKECDLVLNNLALRDEHDFTLRDALFPLEAKLHVMAHLFDAHAALAQAVKTFEPSDVVVIEDTVVVLISHYTRDKADLAVVAHGFDRDTANLGGVNGW